MTADEVLIWRRQAVKTGASPRDAASKRRWRDDAVAVSVLLCTAVCLMLSLWKKDLARAGYERGLGSFVGLTVMISVRAPDSGIGNGLRHMSETFMLF